MTPAPTQALTRAMEGEQKHTEGALIPVAEAARLLGISPWSYYQRAKKNQVPAIRIGKRVYVPVAKLERLIDAP